MMNKLTIESIISERINLDLKRCTFFFLDLPNGTGHFIKQEEMSKYISSHTWYNVVTSSMTNKECYRCNCGAICNVNFNNPIREFELVCPLSFINASKEDHDNAVACKDIIE